MDQSNFEQARQAGKQLVAKRNDFIQESRYSLDRLENNVLSYMFSKVQPEDTPDKLYEFCFSELFAVLNYRTDSYTDIKRLIQKMNALSFWRDAENEDDDDELITFFDSDSVVANQKRGYFKVRFSRKLHPFIMQLQKQKEEKGIFYTSYQLQNVILMKHYYSQRIYEILKTYQYNNKKWKFEIGTGSKYDFQRRIAQVDPETREPIIPAGWKNWHTFERDVLKPAEQDINTLTDIKVTFVPSKYDLAGNKHRRYSSVTFAMVSKTAGELVETDRVIDAEYLKNEREADSERYHQITLDEFFAEHEQQVEAEKAVINAAEPTASDRDADDSSDAIETPYPIFASCLGGEFDDAQIKALFSAACEIISPESVGSGNVDAACTDYVVKYNNYIDATPEDTKTTKFKRLFSAVSKDYQGFARDIILRYQSYRSDIPAKGADLNDYIKAYSDRRGN